MRLKLGPLDHFTQAPGLMMKNKDRKRYEAMLYGLRQQDVQPGWGQVSFWEQATWGIPSYSRALHLDKGHSENFNVPVKR